MQIYNLHTNVDCQNIVENCFLLVQSILVYSILIYFRNAHSELPLMISINPQSHCIHQLTLCLLPDWLMECDPLCDWLVTSQRSLFAA